MTINIDFPHYNYSFAVGTNTTATNINCIAYGSSTTAARSDHVHSYQYLLSHNETSVGINQYGITILGNIDDASLALAKEIKTKFKDLINCKAISIGNLVVVKLDNFKVLLEFTIDLRESDYKRIKEVEEHINKYLKLEMFW